MSHQSAILGRMAHDLHKLFLTKPSWKTSEIDAKAEPLIEQMKNEGLVKSVEACFVEWSGVAEFSLIPVCAEGAWFNVHPSGLVEAY